MNNEELLEQIGKVIDTKLEPVKSDLQAVKQGQVQTNERLTKLEQGQERIEKILDQSIHDIATFFHETWNRLDTVTNNQEKRLQLIEETLGLDEPPHN